MGNVLRRLLGYKRRLNIPIRLIISMGVAGGFQVNQLHVGVNGTERVMCSGRRARERDLVGVS